MKISMINGSQKTGESNTGIILDKLYGLMNGKHEVKMYNSGKKHFANETYQDIMGVKYPFDEKVVVRELLAQIHDKTTIQKAAAPS